MKPILEISNIGKQYKIGGKKNDNLSFREKLKGLLKSTPPQDKIWALDGISFDVNHGDSLGIIGKNGAGKSTLLKILSKITTPTTGYIKARGRVSSLLEVGTGFHPELTGRENIFFNGSILGLTKSEIISKLDMIVDFSGIEQFLETPLKHYSSGMQLRLAFSVAAHLEPEILIVDEVLAVGDVEFQRKCVGKMNEVSSGGRTVIFVSHDLEAIRKLCKKSIILEGGKIKEQGETFDIVDSYLDSFIGKLSKTISTMIGKRLFNDFVIENFSIDLKVRILNIHLELSGIDLTNITSIYYNINSTTGRKLSLIDLRNNLFAKRGTFSKNKITFDTTVDLEMYVEGIYNITLVIEYKNIDFYQSDWLAIQILEKKFEGEQYPGKWRGFFELEHQTEIS